MAIHEKMGWIYLVNDENNGFWIWKEEHGYGLKSNVALPLFQSNRELALSVFGWQGLPLFYNYSLTIIL